MYYLFINNIDLYYRPIGSEYQCKIKHLIDPPDSTVFRKTRKYDVLSLKFSQYVDET